MSLCVCLYLCLGSASANAPDSDSVSAPLLLYIPLPLTLLHPCLSQGPSAYAAGPLSTRFNFRQQVHYARNVSVKSIRTRVGSARCVSMTSLHHFTKETNSSELAHAGSEKEPITESHTEWKLTLLGCLPMYVRPSLEKESG